MSETPPDERPSDGREEPPDGRPSANGEEPVDGDDTPPRDGHRVLVPVEILRGEAVPDAVVEALASVSVVVLGYHEIPEQTAPGQARMQFEERAQNELADVVGAFEAAGAPVTSRLVFTHDPMKTFERIAVELSCDSILLLRAAPTIDRLLVPIRGNVNVEHIVGLVGTLVAGTDIEVTLLHVASEPEAVDDAEALLESAAETLAGIGPEGERIRRTVVVDDRPLETIAEVAEDHDVTVVGESRPSIRDRIFGDPSELIAERSVGPVLVVRRPYLELDEE